MTRPTIAVVNGNHAPVPAEPADGGHDAYTLMLRIERLAWIGRKLAYSLDCEDSEHRDAVGVLFDLIEEMADKAAQQTSP